LVIRSNDQEKRVRSNGREEKNGIHNNQSRIKKMEKKRKERKKEMDIRDALELRL
jgi:hypothetical protein